MNYTDVVYYLFRCNKDRLANLNSEVKMSFEMMCEVNTIMSLDENVAADYTLVFCKLTKHISLTKDKE